MSFSSFFVGENLKGKELVSNLLFSQNLCGLPSDIPF